jgi:hypothetical protein
MLSSIMIGMGNSLPTTSIQKKLERMLDLCTADHVFKGTIFEFDTVGSVPKERLTKGMFVDRREGMRRVIFYDTVGGTCMVNTLLLNIGDSVIILGKQHRQRETATFPMLIMHSETQTLLFSREPETNQWSASDTALSIVYVIGLFIIAITYLIQFLSTNWFHWILLDVAAVVIFLVFFVIVMYQRYLRRERVVHFDSQGWEHVVNIINNRFHFGS